MRKHLDPATYVQKNADKESITTVWAYQILIVGDHANEAKDQPAPTLVYESASAAVNAFMRDYDRHVPLDWIITAPLCIQAEFQNMVVRVFGMRAAAPEERR